VSDTAFYGPRSRENARLLLDAAKALGVHPREIRTQVGGYIVPVKVVDHINGDTEETGEVAEATEVDSVSPTKDEPKRPSTADSKAEWLAYAQDGLGLSVTDENTKAEIIEAVKVEEETD
jgi:hypothetical protein